MKKKLIRCLAAALALLLTLCVCCAEEGEEPAELVPLEPGMNSVEVEDLNARLTVLGYLSEELSMEYDAGTEEAVKAFQTAAGMEATGAADVATLQALMAEDAPVNPENPPKGEMVWVPKTGKKYHTNWNCGGMDGPTCVTKEEAIAQGFEPCSRCYPE